MKIINLLQHFNSTMSGWCAAPSREEFESKFLAPILPWLKPMLDDFSGFRGYGFYDFILQLDWEDYCKRTASLDPAVEEARLRKQIANVEGLLGVKLEGEAVLFSSFQMMDGYARFDRGTHRVYLGVDEEHGPHPYLDVLISHELTHVAREGSPSVWSGIGLDPRMSHDDLVEKMPVIEHLMSEGYSCAVSRLCVPGLEPWAYCYQTSETYAKVMEMAEVLDGVVHRELSELAGYYRNLYRVYDYPQEMPMYSHYVWAWHWAEQVIRDFGGGDPKAVLARPAGDLVDHAIRFKLADLKTGKRI